MEATKYNMKMNEPEIKGVPELIDLEPKNIVAPPYENVFYQNSTDDAAAFALDLPMNVLEPPKEKPPPPPTDINPEEDELLGNVRKTIIFQYYKLNYYIFYKFICTI